MNDDGRRQNCCGLERRSPRHARVTKPADANQGASERQKAATVGGKHMKRATWSGLLALALMASGSQVSADTDSGLNWPEAQQQANGSYSGGSEIATGYQATSEALTALRALGVKVR